jgi:hypothetical protein
MARGNSASTTQQSGNASSNGAVASNTHSSQMRYDVAQLDDDGKKYTAWARTMMLVLRRRGLWNVVSGVAPAPDATADPDAYEAWLNLDQEALIQIILALKEGPQNCVLDAATAKECWDTLAERYKAKDDQRAIFLMEKLFMTQFSDSESLEPQLDQMRLTARALTSVGFPLDDKWLAGIMVMKLPESMATLKAILSHTDSAKLTSTAVTNEILVDEARRIRVGGGDAIAYFAKAASWKAKSRDGNRGNDKYCTHCNKRGHDISECRKVKKENEEKEKAAAASTTNNSGTADTTVTAAIARTTPGDDIIRLFRAIAVTMPEPEQPTSTEPNIEKSEAEMWAGIEHVTKTQADLKLDDLTHRWLIDSGASQTMCSHRHWFQSITPLPKPLKVVLGDDSAIAATGIGHVAVRMHNGTRWAPAILQDVLYVPHLHGNILSVSRFARRGCEIRFFGENCSILDQGKVTTCVGNLRSNLYTMNIEVIGAEVTRAARLDPFALEGEDTTEHALIARTYTPKAAKGEQARPKPRKQQRNRVNKFKHPAPTKGACWKRRGAVACDTH